MEFMPPLNPDLPDGKYQDGDPATSVVGSIPPAEAIEHPMREIVHVIEQELGENTPTKNDLTQLHQAIQAMIDGGIGGSSFTGMIGHFASTTAPSGWLKADGSSQLINSYPSLAAFLGDTYGTATGTHFFLPDLRGEFIRGLDNGRGIDAGRLLEDWQDYGTARPKNTSPEVVTKDGTTTTTIWQASNPSQLGFVRAAKIGEVVTNNSADAHTGAVHELDSFNIMDGDIETRPRNFALLACIKI